MGRKDLGGIAVDLSQLRQGMEGLAQVKVGPDETARAMGSGSELVFATPAMVALMEAAAVNCVETFLPEGHISLGTQIAVNHLAASQQGATISARAELVNMEGRLLHFKVSAYDDAKLVGEGTHSRAVVERERFLAKFATSQ